MNVNVYIWLEDCLKDLHRQLCAHGDAIDFIGVTINSEIFNHGPLWLSFRPIKNFYVEDLWGLLSSAIQSSNNFDVSDRLSINYAIVSSVAGRGRVKLTGENIKKKSILTIKNDDQLCLPRSLAAAYAYIVRGQIRTGRLHDYWNLICRSN